MTSFVLILNQAVIYIFAVKSAFSACRMHFLVFLKQNLKEVQF